MRTGPRERSVLYGSASLIARFVAQHNTGFDLRKPFDHLPVFNAKEADLRPPHSRRDPTYARYPGITANAAVAGTAAGRGARDVLL
jgi:hypothetical protein